ncbi:hypothetical protein [Alsobacter sp. R-9]
MKKYQVLMAGLVCAGCQSPQGSTWAMADFNKYGLYYDEFPTASLSIGMSTASLRSLFGQNMKAVEAGPSGTVYAVDRWVSVAGPDYVGQRLYLNMHNDQLIGWKVANAETLTVVPRSW